MSTSSEQPPAGGAPPVDAGERVAPAAEDPQHSLATDQVEGEEWVEGGEITLGPEPVSWKEKHESETAKVVAFSLLAILAGSIVLHYVAVIILMVNDQKDTVDVLSQVFDSWLPVISGFVGGAVTFYLTRQKG